MSTTIIIPCKDGLNYTKNCLMSIFTKTKAPFKVIVVDDGSTEETKRSLRKIKNITLLIPDDIKVKFTKDDIKSILYTNWKIIAIKNTTINWNIKNTIDVIMYIPDISNKCFNDFL